VRGQEGVASGNVGSNVRVIGEQRTSITATKSGTLCPQSVGRKRRVFATVTRGGRSSSSLRCKGRQTDSLTTCKRVPFIQFSGADKTRSRDSHSSAPRLIAASHKSLNRTAYNRFSLVTSAVYSRLFQLLFIIITSRLHDTELL